MGDKMIKVVRLVDITTGNDAIASFLKWFKQEGQEGTWFYTDDCSTRVAYSIHNNYPHRDLPFHRSMNDLMNVVDVINEITKDRTLIEYCEGKYFCTIQYRQKIFFKEGSSFIDAVWQCVVEFIQWYQSNISNEKITTKEIGE